jgi:tripartite-type tricarboxylate transporter receptor subunit TctC
MMRRRSLLALAAGLPLPALAQPIRPWPERPLRVVVPFPPGGAIDAMARLLAGPMAEALGQPVLVENRPGAGGTTGTGFAAQSNDGHTLLMVSIAHAVNPALYPRLPYAESDFAPLGPVAVVPNILVVPAARPWRSVADLRAAARARPGGLTYASAGSGTSIHLAGALFADRAGITWEHVPYRGSAPAVTDLVAGRVDAMFDSVTSAAPHIASGRLMALGVSTSRRVASFPELPTMAEAGVPDCVVDPWFAMLAQRSVPGPALPLLSDLLARLLADETMAERLGRIGAEPMAGDAASLARLLAEETARWGVFVRRAGIKPE